MSQIRILVDCDACPVKDEIYKVAWRREVRVSVVSNMRMRVPEHPLIERVLVSDKFDAADDWIAESADAKTVVITGDILLADRCLKNGATVIGHNGKPFTTASIGGAIATRAIMADLRVATTASPAGRSPLRKLIGRGFCRRWMRRWCGSRGLEPPRPIEPQKLFCVRFL